MATGTVASSRSATCASGRIPDDLAAALAQEADRLGVSVSDLVRQGMVVRLALARLHEAHEEGEDTGPLLAAWARYAARESRGKR